MPARPRTDWVRRLKQLLYPKREDLTLLKFDENGSMTALIPTQERFGLTREMILQRVYEQEAGDLDVDLVVDAGANVGLFTLLASRHARHVVALEPDPINHHVLAINLLANKITNVDALESALWTEEGSVSFGRPVWEQEHGFVASTAAHVRGAVADAGGAGAVQATTLDSIVERYGDIDLLKLDIEGAEHAVIPSARVLGRIRRIVAELHLTDAEQRRVMVETLEAAGFRVRLIESSSLFRPRHARTIIQNWGRLQGELAVKLGLMAYLLAPVQGKGVGPGRDLPLLVASRD